MLSSHSRLSRAIGVTASAALVATMAAALSTPSEAAQPARTTTADDTDSLVESSVLTPDFVPATSMAQVLRQPDGTSFRAKLSPASRGGLFEVDGFSVSRDDAGVWRYVTGRDSQGELQLSGAAVGEAVPAGLQKRAGRQVTQVDPKEAAIRESIQRQLQVASLQAQQAAAAAGEPRVFKVPAVLFATWWDAEAGQTSPQFQPGHDKEYFKSILDGFGGNPNGSMTQFYFEASFGQFLVQVDVYGPYVSNRSREDRCYYGDIGDTAGSPEDPLGDQIGAGGGGVLGMAIELQNSTTADADIDWSQYDSDDSDRRVDFAMFIHSGGDMAATGNPCFTWSHALQATLGQCEAVSTTYGFPTTFCQDSGIQTNDGVFLDRLLTIPEFASATDPLTIGVAAHEMAHAIGEPDYYDTSYSSVGTGDYDLMSGGTYMGNPSGSNPTMMNPVSRVFQGWLTPTVVQGDLRRYKLKPRTALPFAGYDATKPDPNLLLVPTYEIAQGETDSLGHTWGADDVYGLPKNPKTGKYIVEGFYVENVSRHAVSPKLSAQNPMGSMFDRKSHGSGLIVWHFDYWRQSTTYFAHANDAQNNPQRYQLDVEEFDQNDNTQELQLNYSRGNPADYLVGAATGITSGTRMLPPRSAKATGDPQKSIDIQGASLGPVNDEVPFTVEANPANLLMTVSAGSEVGDCTLSLTDPSGNTTPVSDSGFVGAAETISVKNPAPGQWTANVGDFLACGQWSGRVIFEGNPFITSGGADTWSNWSKQPTGWAFTNVSGGGNGIDVTNEAGGTEDVTLDVLNLSDDKDVSPGFITGKTNASGGTDTGINVGKARRLQVPVFSNGGKAPGKVRVTIRSGSAKGRVIERKSVKLGTYERKNVSFRYKAKQEGPQRLFAIVDENKRIKEGSEKNQVQATTLWAGPRRPKVLIVDDDQALTHERAIAGGLAALGVRYTIAHAHPTAKKMRRYKAVIWESSVDRNEGQLDKYDRAELRTYLNGGGRLLMTSNRIFDAVGGLGSPQSADEGVEFAAQYLGARIPEGNSTYVVVQREAATVHREGLLGRKPMRINPAPARPFIGLAGLAQAGNGALGSVIKPFGTARGIAKLGQESMEAVQPASDQPYIGIAVDGDREHGSFKTVTLGWNLGDDVNAGATAKVLRKVLKDFGVKIKRYRVKTKKPVIYHSSIRDQVSGQATTVTAVVRGGKAKKPKVKLFYRRHGLGKFYKVKMTKTGRHSYSATIPGRAFTPEGVDYYIKAGKTKDPYGTKRAPLYHGIAVALPMVPDPLPIKKK